MALLKFSGNVRTNKVGSGCDFEFEVDEDDLPKDSAEREAALDERALEALWESGMVEWSYEQIEES